MELTIAAFCTFKFAIVTEAMVPVARLNVPVAARLVVVALANWILVPVAESKPREVIKAERELRSAAKKLVVVALEIEAFCAKVLEEVELVKVALVVETPTMFRF